MARLFCCSTFSLKTLNYSAAIFHLIQAAIVLGIIQHLDRSDNRTYGLNSGIYNLKKNIFVIVKNAENNLNYAYSSDHRDDAIFLGGSGVLDTNSGSKINDDNKCSLPKVEIINMTKKMIYALSAHNNDTDGGNRQNDNNNNNNSAYNISNNNNQIDNLLERLRKKSSLFLASSSYINAFDFFTSQTTYFNDVVGGNSNTMLVGIQRNDIFMFDDSKYLVIPQSVSVGDIDIRYIIFSFFLLSGLFQLTDGLIIGSYTASNDTTNKKPVFLRFVEYSFSASIMIIAIAVQTGVNDIYALCGIFTLIFTTNILGLIAECLCYCAEILQLGVADGKGGDGGVLKRIDEALPSFFPSFVWFWTIPHFLGWITCMVAYAPLLDSYLNSSRCSERGPPGFVHVIVFLEFFMFSCFGFVQLYSLYRRTSNCCLNVSTSTAINGGTSSSSYNMMIGNKYSHHPLTNNQYYYNYSPSKFDHRLNAVMISEQADYLYILLSFTAKTLLAWLILSPSLMS